MLLQPSNPKIFHQKSHHPTTNLAPLTSNSLSFSSGFLQNSVLFPKQPIIISTSYVTRRTPLFIARSWLPEANTQEEAGSDKGNSLKWIAIHKKISTLEDPNLGSASVLNQLKSEGKKISKWDLYRVVKELRKFSRYTYALQIYEWMNNQAGIYRMTSSDIAIQLDLIGKVHGISSAEQYFEELPDAFKDKRTYGALLNAYVRAKKREEAESIMNKMRNRGYANDSLTFNVMMTLYKHLKENDKIELLIGEMKEKNIQLDSYSFNIWLSACESLEKLEEVFGQMQLAIKKLHWATYCTMASFYIKFGDFAKSELYLRKIEGGMTRPGWRQYQYLIGLYGSIGKKEDVYRIWNLYKATFPNIPNLGYYSIISSLLKLDDIEGAERVYNEWLSVKSVYETRVGNLLLQSYVSKGLSEKAKTFLDQMIVAGGKPNSITWEILAEDFIRCRNIPEALSYLGKAASVECSNNYIWKPKPANVSLILEIIEGDSDVASKDVLFGLLRKVGCLDDAGYMSAARISNDVVGNEDRVASDVNDEDFVVYDQLQENF